MMSFCWALIEMGSHGDWNPAMKRRTLGVLLVAGLVVAAMATAAVLPSVALARAITRSFAQNSCDFGFRNLIIGCTFQASRTTTTAPFEQRIVDQTSWDVTNHCPLGPLARRLLCAATETPASGDLEVQLSEATGLPLPRGRLLTTEKNSPLIKSVHAEMPLDLASVLRFYRVELKKRGWTENDGAVVEPDRAVIAFMTSDGPALLRLIHQDNRTIADLSLRKDGAVVKPDILPSPGQVKLMLGNTTDEEAVVAINDQTIKLAARASLPDGPEIDLPPGKFKVALKVPGDPAQNREFEVGANETWGLLVGPAGVPLPVHVY
jgi:hypothetical protein